MTRSGPFARSAVVLCLALVCADAASAAGLPEVPHALRAITRTRKTRLLGAWGGYTLRGGGTLLVFAPPGRQALSGDGGPVLRIWDTQSGRQLRLFTGPQGHVTSAAFSSDGRLLVTGGRDGSVVVREAHTGKVLRTLHRHRGEVSAVAFAPNGRTVVSGGEDGLVRVWTVGDGLLLGALEGHEDWVRALAIAGDGKRAFSAGDDGTVRVWDLSRRRALFALGGRESGPVTGLAPSPEGTLLAAAVPGVGIQLWDLAQRTPVRTQPVGGLVLDLGFAPDGQSVAAVGLARAPVRRASDPAPSEGQRLTFGRWGLGDGAASGWDAPSDGIAAAALSPDGTRALAASANALRIWDVAGRAVRVGSGGHGGRIQAIALSPVGPWAVSAARDGSARIWDTRTGSERALLGPFGQDVKAAAFSPDGRLALVADVAGLQQLWNVETAQPVRTLGLHRGLAAVAFAPDGLRSLSASYERIAVWDLETGKELSSIGFSGLVSGVVFGADGRTVLTLGCGSDLPQLREVATGRVLATVGRPGRPTSAIALSPDGTLAALATPRPGGNEPAVELWRLPDGKRVRGGCGEGLAGIDLLRFSPDGRMLLSAGEDGQVRLWSVKGCREIDRIDYALNAERATALAFSPDGQGFVTGSSLGAMHHFLFVDDPTH